MDSTPDNTTSGQVTLPNGGQVTTPTESPEEKSAAMQSWMKTAGGGSARPATAPSNGGGAAQPAAAVAPVRPPTPAPTAPVVTSTKRPGFPGVMDSVLDALVGRTRPELGRDENGYAYVKQHTLTHGEQWMRIAGEAMQGAAAGLAAGRGAGNMGKAAQAGIQAGTQARDKENADVQKQVLDDANNQMLRMNMAEQTWRNTRLQTEATQHDIAFWQGQEDRLTKAGATELGTVAHPGDLTGVRKANPDIMKDLVQKHALEFVPQVGEDGKTAGFKVFKTTEGYRDTQVPAGAEFPTFNTVKGEYEWHKTTQAMSQGQIDDYWNSAGNTALKFKGDQAENEVKGATKKNLESEATARDQELQPKIALTRAQTGEAQASAAEKRETVNLDKEKEKQIRAGIISDDGTPNPRLDLMANAMLSGDILPTDLKREAKGAGIDPNAIVARAFEISKATGQQFSLPILEQEHNFAKNAKTQAALDGIDRVLGTTGSIGPLDQMLDLAKAANLKSGPLGGPTNSVTLAVQRFFGDTAAKNLNTSIADTRRTIAGLIGNPLLGGSETDKKLEQAEDMLGGNPTMANLQGASDILKTALGTQKQSIVGNNRYLRKRYGTAGAAAAPAAERPAPARPPNVPATAHWDWNANGGSGMWIP